jgi:hypothetical protein
MTNVAWGEEIPASAGIEMLNRMVNDVSCYYFLFMYFGDGNLGSCHGLVR